MEEYPKIAIVGLKGCGKSSLISTLTFNDTIFIKPTTTINSYKIENSCRVFYEFIDTPAFIFTKEIVGELKALKAPSHKRYEALQKFIQTYKNESLLQNDIAILETIIKSDGIIFLSDAKKNIATIHPLLELMLYFKKPILPVININKRAIYLHEYKTHFKLFFNNYICFDLMHNTTKNILYFYKHLTTTLNNWNKNYILVSKEIKKSYKKRLQQSATIISSFIFWLIHFQTSQSGNLYYIKNSYIKQIQEEEFAMHKMLLSLWEHYNITLQKNWLHIDNNISLHEKSLTKNIPSNNIFANSKLLLDSLAIPFESLFEQFALFAFGNKNYTLKRSNCAKNDSNIPSYSLGPITNEAFYLLIIKRALNLVKNITTLSYAKRGTIELKETLTLTPLQEERLKGYLKALLLGKESKESFESFLFSLLQLI